MQPRERAIREWAAEVKETDRGALLLVNLAHELDRDSIPTELLARLVNALADCWLKRAGNTPMEVFRKSLRLVGEEVVCQGQPTLPPPQRCSRIMTATDFVRYHVKIESGGLIPELEVPPHVIQYLEQEGLAELAKGILKTSQPVVWVTDSSEIERVRAGSERPPANTTSGAEICEIATQLRERLGLNHYAEDQHLLELVYPEGLPDDACPLHPPTILDGIGSIYYRSGRSIGGWGVTVDLASGEAGLPEAVHAPTNLTEDFRVRNLGRIRGNNTRITYAGVAERAPTQWSSACLERLMTYLEATDNALN